MFYHLICYQCPSNFKSLENKCCNMIRNTCSNANAKSGEKLNTVTSLMVKNALEHLNKRKKDESYLLYSNSIIGASD